MTNIIRRVASFFSVDAILAVGCRFGCVEACLPTVSTRARVSGRMVAYLNEVFALRLRHKWLELGGGKGVNEAGFGYDEKQDLGAGENRELVRLDTRGYYATPPN